MASNTLLKISQFAKDLNLKSKDIVEVFEGKKVTLKSQTMLAQDEFEILFEALTRKNQIDNIGDYIDGVTYIPSRKKADEPKEEKAAPAPEAQKPVEKAPEVKAAEVKAPKVQAPEVKAPEANAPEVKAPEVKAPEKKVEAPAKQPAAKPAAPVEKKPAAEPVKQPAAKPEVKINNEQKPRYEDRSKTVQGDRSAGAYNAPRRDATPASKPQYRDGGRPSFNNFNNDEGYQGGRRGQDHFGGAQRPDNRQQKPQGQKNSFGGNQSWDKEDHAPRVPKEKFKV